jgi:hypothetical protein
MCSVGVVGKPETIRNRVVDIFGQVIAFEVFITAFVGCNSNFLCAPIEIGADFVSRKYYERAHAGMGVKDAFGVGISSAGCSEWE